jgi:CheY-like chemotaxis protein
MKDQIRADSGEPSRPLTGVRLLLVEDEALVALELEEMIVGLGADVVGPFSRVADALDALQHEVTGAVLDVHVDGDTTFQVVDALLERSKPVLFVTGSALELIPEKYRQLPRLHKPFEDVEFIRLVKSVFNHVELRSE